MDIKNITASFNPKLLPIQGFILAIIFWTLDSVVDLYLFDEHVSFFEAMFTPEPIELWMRSLVVVMLVMFSFYARRLLVVQNKISQELIKYKNHLEELVKERTDRLEIMNSSLKQEIESKKIVEKKLEYMAETDSLTELYNRRKFDEILDYEIEKNKRYNLGLSIIFCDIDNFKNINDTYGHDIGDEVLRTFALKLKDITRESDIVARWGGEEFTILITNTNEVGTVESLADKIRQEIANCKFDKVGKVTSSFGVTFFKENDNKNTILKRVDEALYKAKNLGKNCVEIV